MKILSKEILFLPRGTDNYVGLVSYLLNIFRHFKSKLHKITYKATTGILNNSLLWLLRQLERNANLNTTLLTNTGKIDVSVRVGLKILIEAP